MNAIICCVFFGLEIAFYIYIAAVSYKESPNKEGIDSLARTVLFPSAILIAAIRCTLFVTKSKFLFLDSSLQYVHIATVLFFVIACGELFNKKIWMIIGGSFIALALLFNAWNSRNYKIERFRQYDTPESSCFSRIGYDKDTCDILVTFRDSGDTYIYDTDEEWTWEDFKSADSLGTYYNEHIKGVYYGEKQW